MSSKALLRESVRRQVRALLPSERHSLSGQLCDLLRAKDSWGQSTTVLLFAPLADEPDIIPLVDDALVQGKKVTLPHFDSNSGSYAAAQITSRAQLQPGQFGAFEPIAGCPVVPLNQLDFILVPGVAFDLTGRRLGRGKGFYDRLLAQVRGHKCGVAFDAQIVAEVPEEPHDVCVDSILTPTRWHLCRRAA